jgi:hypothetical protein
VNASIGSDRFWVAGVTPQRPGPPGLNGLVPVEFPAALRDVEDALEALPLTHPTLCAELADTAKFFGGWAPVHEAAHLVMACSRGAAILWVSAAPRGRRAGAVCVLRRGGGRFRERCRTDALMAIAGPLVNAAVAPEKNCLDAALHGGWHRITDVASAMAGLRALQTSDQSATAAGLVREAADLLARPHNLAAVTTIARELFLQPQHELRGSEAQAMFRRTRRAWKRFARHWQPKGESMLKEFLGRGKPAAEPAVKTAPDESARGEAAIRALAKAILYQSQAINQRGAAPSGGDSIILDLPKTEDQIERAYVARGFDRAAAQAVLAELFLSGLASVSSGVVTLTLRGQSRARELREDKEREQRERVALLTERHNAVTLDVARSTIAAAVDHMKERTGGDLGLLPILGVSFQEFERAFVKRRGIELAGTRHDVVIRCIGCGNEEPPARIFATRAFDHLPVCPVAGDIAARAQAARELGVAGLE